MSYPAVTHYLKQLIDNYSACHPASEAEWQQAGKAMPGGNTRSSLWMSPFPLCITDGDGCRIRDSDGHHYLDFLGEFTAGIFGHTPRRLIDAITTTAEHGLHLSSQTPHEAHLAARLCARFPAMGRVRFSNSGTEANLMAIVAARAFTGRSRIIVFQGGYHGGVLSFGLADNPVNAPFEFIVLPYNDLPKVAAALQQQGESVAAVLVEPMQGAGGCVVGDPAFLQGLRDLTTRHGALLIFDEVQTARMAAGGVQQRLNIAPDLTTLGKFFGGGLAFGAFGGRTDVMDQFNPLNPRALSHAGTFNNNALTMAAGIVAIDHYLTPEALDALYARGETFRQRIADLIAAKNAPYYVTGMGSIMNIHPLHAEGEVRSMMGRILHLEMLARGIWFAQRGLVALSLPIGGQEMDDFIAALSDTLEAVGTYCTEC
ncbi:TPA: aspartate aminotransferase family protein [Klebsiella michiganensis]|nr:aminotransferase class III-fold pyridoxal phosphate-dependent enzyme [Enterobacter hormaechei subsp. steigerwaltii]HAV1583967.1 aminotransferase class III-fold pyridoxal phosphate-dependent enzyme [Enterobacter hormaechei subsp. steigerwaltii]HAV1867097.1 aminotransferase class III-fold pyridoxal phosphate-dependent enzyme [Enterobacter hormaechei subsp. steigerwaltii]